MIKKGTQVSWKWGTGTAKGKVQETYTKKVTKTIKGNEVTRNGEEGNKALYIQQEDGDYVLKSESEVKRED
ncbi:hypervirulence associated TUDOR domain-containing protein [Mariniflexile sp.]|uniref:hypervirulence associated TUDOR domain-containing protein n=1 Tax=Mariniflexile sp. TaxID=1979402 RepID=UPI004047C4F9